VRNVIATCLQFVALVGFVVAGFLWCVPAGVAAASTAVFTVGFFMVDE
jgi:hypothetical protein